MLQREHRGMGPARTAVRREASMNRFRCNSPLGPAGLAGLCALGLTLLAAPPAAAQPQDGDGDGFAPPEDCDDEDPAVHPGVAELVCNGVDDDCDQATDEDFPADQPCQVGLGLCRRSGVLLCPADAFGPECSVVPGAAQPEVCGNGIDDDCDGAVDGEGPFAAAVSETGLLYQARWDAGAGRLGPPVLVANLAPASGQYCRGVAMADFTGDGQTDVLVGRNAGATTWIYLFANDGCGNLVNRGEVASMAGQANYAMDYAAGDFDGDGNADLLAQGSSNKVGVFLGDGRGGLRDVAEVAATATSRGLDAGDFDGDGRLDFVRGRYSAGVVELFLGQGDGSFAAARPMGTFGNDPYGVVAGDFDSDGRLDVIAMGGSTGDARFYKGNGNGTFVAGVAVPSLDTDRLTAYDAFDFDASGTLDLVAVDHDGRRLLYFPGQGDATFGPPQLAGSLPANSLGLAVPPRPRPAGQLAARIRPFAQQVAHGAAATLDGSPSAGPVASWRWLFAPGLEPLTGEGQPGQTSFVYPQEGVARPQLEVRDGQGGQDRAAATVVVRGAAPTVSSASLQLGEAQAVRGSWPLALNGGDFAVDDGGIVRWRWELPDGWTEGFEEGPAGRWQPAEGTWAVVQGGAIAGARSYRQSNASLSRARSLDLRRYSGDVQVGCALQLLAGSSPDARLHVDAADPFNGYELALRGGNNNDLLLLKRGNDTATTLLDVNLPAPVEKNRTYRLELAHLGDLLEVRLDGVLQAAVHDAGFK
ncbi:MAG: hypothetical protein FJ125_07080, partial [Deltaproteobacteria bacterium]|nr:hypothetical protein [Deltaproteobacteria bacterium]